jgi:hypothetical protein
MSWTLGAAVVLVFVLFLCNVWMPRSASRRRSRPAMARGTPSAVRRRTKSSSGDDGLPSSVDSGYGMFASRVSESYPVRSPSHAASDVGASSDSDDGGSDSDD